MADIFGMLKRGGKEMAQESAKTDGMCKGTSGGVGGAGPVDLNKRGGKEYAQTSAKTDGCCK
jgi:hypothetical protein